jgi:hypothetical protein
LLLRRSRFADALHLPCPHYVGMSWLVHFLPLVVYVVALWQCIILKIELEDISYQSLIPSLFHWQVIQDAATIIESQRKGKNQCDVRQKTLWVSSGNGRTSMYN